MKKIALYSFFGKLIATVRPRRMRTLIREKQAEMDQYGDLRIIHPTDQEVDETNQVAMAQREAIRDLPMPDHLKRYFASWDEIFIQIDDGRRWRSQQPGQRTANGNFASLREGPATMVFV